MPRFFFNLRCGEEAAEADALDLSGSRAAWQEAIRLCRDLLHDTERLGECSTEWEMDVTNEAGRRIILIRFVAESFADE
ncbi:MAG TPA: hypothetical protein VFJ18_12740 [Pararhizobium sp.]|jgi:hypothetical protein|nr:hypothetical protein [Pararhizobium sp.]